MPPVQILRPKEKVQDVRARLAAERAVEADGEGVDEAGVPRIRGGRAVGDEDLPHCIALYSFSGNATYRLYRLKSHLRGLRFEPLFGPLGLFCEALTLDVSNVWRWASVGRARIWRPGETTTCDSRSSDLSESVL